MVAATSGTAIGDALSSASRHGPVWSSYCAWSTASAMSLLAATVVTASSRCPVIEAYATGVIRSALNWAIVISWQVIHEASSGVPASAVRHAVSGLCACGDGTGGCCDRVVTEPRLRQVAHGY